MSDKILWDNLKKGDYNAFEQVYRQYFQPLYNYGKKLQPDIGLVEDTLQDLFIDIWNKRTSLSNTDNILPYMMVAFRRKLVKAIQKSKKISSSEPEEYQFESELAIDALLINQEINQEKKASLEKAFSQLSTRQKEVLYLKYYQDMDYEGISEIMELNYQSARNLVSRALTQLAKVLQVLLIFFHFFLK